ncbi:MAG: biotin/lipoyl-binding protein, partial [Armatimonadota bacterium]
MANRYPSVDKPEMAAALPELPRSLQMVAPQRSGRRIAAVLIGLFVLAALILIYVPWQQTVIGYGQVMVYSAMDRPQNVQAQIPGRLLEWRVQEGDVVKAGDVIARLEDIDSKYLDRDQPRRLALQRAALRDQRDRATSRGVRIEEQMRSLTSSREAAIRTARQRVEQSRQRLRAAQQALIASQKGGQIARDVARTSAGERVAQARLRVEQAEQALTAAKQERETSRLQRDRIKALFDDGLRSGRDNELAENDFVKRQTDVERAELALKVARRDTTVGALDQNRADIEIERVNTEVERAKAALDVAERDVLTAQLDLSKITADTTAGLDSLGASLESARENIAKIDSELQKIQIEQQNLSRRTGQQIVTAPRAGRVVRLLQVGNGATVKVGDILAVLAPTTKDRAVELLVTDNDVALLADLLQTVGRLHG